MIKHTYAESFYYLESVSGYQRTVTIGKRAVIALCIVSTMIVVSSIVYSSMNDGIKPEYVRRFRQHAEMNRLEKDIRD